MTGAVPERDSLFSSSKGSARPNSAGDSSRSLVSLLFEACRLWPKALTIRIAKLLLLSMGLRHDHRSPTVLVPLPSILDFA